MKWFDILKVLGTKTGFSQLDFDNIVIEEEDDCKRRWKQICDELSKVKIEGYWNDESKESTHFYLLPEDKPSPYDGSVADLDYSYNEEIPEEAYCIALDLLKAGKSGGSDNSVEGFGIYFVKSDYYKYESYVTIYSLTHANDNSAMIGYLTNPERPSLDNLDMEAEVLKILPKLKEAFPY